MLPGDNPDTVRSWQHLLTSYQGDGGRVLSMMSRGIKLDVCNVPT